MKQMSGKIRGFGNFFLASVLIIGLFASICDLAVAQHDGDGTCTLKVGENIRASNGYTVKLSTALGEFGSYSDWKTELRIYDPDGNFVGFDDNYPSIVTFDRYWAIDVNYLTIMCARENEGEAIIAVISPDATTAYEGNGTYNLRVGDSVRSTNGYVLKFNSV